MNFIKLDTRKLDVSYISDLVAHESCGAVSVFIGTTRDNFEEKKVLSLDYEAFEPMALKTMNAICDELRAQWPDIQHIAIYHRLGNVPVKEASIVIAISSPHRESSLQAVQHAIETLKKSVPIWKKEQYEGDESAWKENKESEEGSAGPRAKRAKLNFDACTVEAAPLSKTLVQITADDVEVARRIQCFVEKKREEIDLQNVSSFTERTSGQQGEVASCARVNSIVFKQKDSAGHLRVRRVKNEIGPQIKPDYASTLNKLMGNVPKTIQIKQEATDVDQPLLPHGLEERLHNIEEFMGHNNKPPPKNLYDRVKILEDRILYLESISPEYHHFLGQKSAHTSKKRKKASFTVEDLDTYIYDIQKSMVL